MEQAIDHFLNCTARWMPRWFNKPKFHLIRHLPEHVRRFGPAVLFATEAFESFNAVIRARSVHSNRQAPSRDIAHGFARVNRIRHLLSGGYFLYRPELEEHTPLRFSDSATHWVTAAPAPLGLAQQRLGVVNIIGDYLGIRPLEPNQAGMLRGVHYQYIPNSCWQFQASELVRASKVQSQFHGETLALLQGISLHQICPCRYLTWSLMHSSVNLLQRLKGSHADWRNGCL